MIRKDCPCPKIKCPRHGDCSPCTEFHASKGRLPYCKRPKSSISNLFKKILGNH